MDKLSMETPNLTMENVEKIEKLFPNCVKESEDEEGNKIKKVDFDLLRAELGDKTSVEGLDERYRLDWPGKKRSILKANTPITKTLRPVKEDSVDWDNTGNLYIEGDNFEVLKILQESYLGKIKMIYIDPPYNTGKDFVYNDDFAEDSEEYRERTEKNEDGYKMVRNMESNGRFHSDWLSMMYERLKVARDLLTDDGVIFISIDDNEQDNLKKICDEIFGCDNFIAPILWQSKSGGAHDEKYIVREAEYIFVYSKNKNEVKLSRRKNTDGNYTLSDEYENIRGKYILNKLDRRMTSSHYTESLNYPITMPDNSELRPGGESVRSNLGWNWRRGKDKLEWGLKNGFIEMKKGKNGWAVYSKQYENVDNNNNIIERAIPYRNLYLSSDFSTTQASSEIINFFDFKIFEYAKPCKILEEFITISNLKGTDIVLDFFSGSATTAQACMELNAKDGGNRKYIMVQLPELTEEKSEAYKAGYKNICEIGKERIRRAAKKIKEETNADIDYGFRVYRVDESCMKDVYYHPSKAKQENLALFTSNIKDDRTSEDLLTQVILNLGLTLDLPIEEKRIKNNKVFYVAGNSLVACFDENIDFDIIEEIAKDQPLKMVLRDSSFRSDADRINFENTMKELSKDTIIKVI